jgi:hypothetical protein
MPLLRLVTGLSVGIKLDFIDAGLPRGAWLGVLPICA